MKCRLMAAVLAPSSVCNFVTLMSALFVIAAAIAGSIRLVALRLLSLGGLEARARGAGFP
jgi:hypothetical protein